MALTGPRPRRCAATPGQVLLRCMPVVGPIMMAGVCPGRTVAPVLVAALAPGPHWAQPACDSESDRNRLRRNKGLGDQGVRIGVRIRTSVCIAYARICASRACMWPSHYFCTLTPYKMDVAFVACYITGLAHGGHVLIYFNGRLPHTTRRCVILNFQNKNSPKSMPRSFRTGKWPLTLQMWVYRPYLLNSMLFECYFSETEIFFCSCYQEESE